MAKAPILLIGCGKMGSAMLDGWLSDDQLDADFTVIEPFQAARDALKGRDVAAYASAAEMATARTSQDLAIHMVVLAVKPQMMAETLDDFLAAAGASVGPDTAYLSIAAGITGGLLTRHLGAEANWLRAMPNTPAAIGQGITALYAPDHVPSDIGRLASQLLSAIGQVEMLATEAQMDAVTALSGSGPAYVFLLAEAMAAAGHRLGLPEDMSMQLAIQTIKGAGALMAADDSPPAVLRKNVTSKGGTTAAALSVLMQEQRMVALMDEALDAAAKRAAELDAQG